MLFATTERPVPVIEPKRRLTPQMKAFCAVLDGLSGKSIVSIREELQSVELPSEFNTIVVREPYTLKRIGSWWRHPEKPRLTAFDVVRMVVENQFIEVKNWSESWPLVHDVTWLNGEPRDPEDTLAIVVECELDSSYGPADAPPRYDLRTLDDVTLTVP